MSTDSPYLHGPLGPLFARTTAPIALVLMLNGLLTIVDAFFLGRFVGAEALAAVTLMFPLMMLIAALTTLVSSGMASVVARRLGAGDTGAAAQAFGAAHGLSLLIWLALALVWATLGPALSRFLAQGSDEIAVMGASYVSILLYAAPIGFALSLQSDGFRVEGRVPLMAALGIAMTLLNGLLDWLFIAKLGLGVPGSAWATLAAQVITLLVVIGIRLGGHSPLPLPSPRAALRVREWGPMAALGAPSSLSFLGIALVTGAVVFMLRIVGAPEYEATTAAYGILLRLLSFAFLGLMGMNLAMQAIVGTCHGAGAHERANATLRLGLRAGFVYCLLIELFLIATRHHLAGFFTEDAEVQRQLARIVPYMVALYALGGPLHMVGAFFQAVGDARRAAIIGLSRAYLMSIPLTLVLPLVLGEIGIWIAPAIADLLFATLVLVVLARHAASKGRAGHLLAASP